MDGYRYMLKNEGRPQFTKITLIESRRGKPMLQMGENRYYKHSSNREGHPKVLWVCVKWWKGCRSSIKTFENQVFSNIVRTVSRQGKPMLQKGPYRYYQHNCYRTGPKGFWLCVRKASGCPAQIKTVDDIVTHMVDEHNHF
uniref:SFRICE_013750 n=1 Tax=Spodoptera frugiperda TaxID=7108 RepID=A0A2H1VJN4_SPOFR